MQAFFFSFSRLTNGAYHMCAAFGFGWTEHIVVFHVWEGLTECIGQTFFLLLQPPNAVSVLEYLVQIWMDVRLGPAVDEEVMIPRYIYTGHFLRETWSFPFFCCCFFLLLFFFFSFFFFFFLPLPDHSCIIT